MMGKHPEPPTCPTISAEWLRPGDVLYLHGHSWVSIPIEIATQSPWCHAAMVIEVLGMDELQVAEMTWPVARITPLRKWLKTEGQVWASRLQEPLSAFGVPEIEEFWLDKVGKGYDLPLLLGELPVVMWQRLALGMAKWPLMGWMQNVARIQPPTMGYGVCSVCCAWAWKQAGLPVNETTGMTPADLVEQSFVRPLEQILVV